MVLDFEPGQTAYDVDAMESPAEHPDVADARQRRKAGPSPVTLISCLEARLHPFCMHQGLCQAGSPGLPCLVLITLLRKLVGKAGCGG